jgi:RsiW-degrading membrane proteinase PrsW (M82 family)
MDPTTTPAGYPPAGVIPNFVDPPSLSPVYRGVIYSFVPLMFVFLFGRLYVRTRTLRDFWFDDGTSKILIIQNHQRNAPLRVCVVRCILGAVSVSCRVSYGAVVDMACRLTGHSGQYYRLLRRSYTM